MKIRNLRRNIGKSLGLVAVGASAAALANSAESQAQTTLTGLTATNQPVPANHGSNAAGTPNVTLTWDPLWDQYNNWPNDPGNGVYQHDRGLNNPHTISFTPDADWNVILSSFDLNVWPGGGNTDVDWSVDGTASGNLGAGTFSILNGTVSNETLDFVGMDNETLTLSLTQTSGLGSYLALDNLTFDQVAVPEPGTLGMFLLLGGAAGMGAAAIRRRRK